MNDAIDRETFVDDLAESRWTTLAKHAWRLYQEQGRGAVVYPMAGESSGDEVAAGEERTPLRYLTFTDDDAAQSGPFSMLHHFVQTYDPETEIVVVVQFPDDSTAFDVYQRSPAPPDAE